MTAREDYPVDPCIDYKRHESDRVRYELMADEIDALRTVVSAYEIHDEARFGPSTTHRAARYGDPDWHDRADAHHDQHD